MLNFENLIQDQSVEEINKFAKTEIVTKVYTLAKELGSQSSKPGVEQISLLKARVNDLGVPFVDLENHLRYNHCFKKSTEIHITQLKITKAVTD